jgi:4-amino-4-deoxy-L-arabinose transferase-like glycosyltransferase
MMKSWWTREQLPFYLFTFTLLMAMVLPALIREGMFMDGMIYAVVSKNLAADNFSSWWKLRVSDAMMNPYYDQPPLTFWIQAFFFKALGNGIYTERVYSFMTLLVNAVLIIRLWKQIYRNHNDTASIGWFPVILWIIVPVCYWSFANNMQENTMSVFVLASVYFGYKGYMMQHRWSLLLSGLFIFLAGMTKGIQGTFAIVFPVILFFVFRKHSFTRSVLFSVQLAAIPSGLFALMMCFPESRHYFEGYQQARLVNTFTNETFVSESRWHLIKKLAESLAVPIALCVMILWIKKSGRILLGDLFSKRVAAAFFLLALCGTLPLMITKEQRRFYLVTAMPYFAIGMAALVEPKVQQLIRGITDSPSRQQKALALGGVCMAAVLLVTACSAGKTSRDADLLHDVQMTASVLKPDSHACIEAGMLNRYSLLLYFARYHNISLFNASSCTQVYLITDLHTSSDHAGNYTKVNLPLKNFALFKRKIFNPVKGASTL